MKESLHEQLYGDLDAVKVSDGSVLHCKKVSDREDSPFDPIDALNLKVKGCSEQLIMNCRSIVQESSETSFMNKHQVPYLNEIFLKDPFKYSVYGMVDGVDPNGNISDWKLGYAKYKNKPLYVFFIEVKVKTATRTTTIKCSKNRVKRKLWDNRKCCCRQ